MRVRWWRPIGFRATVLAFFGPILYLLPMLLCGRRNDMAAVLATVAIYRWRLRVAEAA